MPIKPHPMKALAKARSSAPKADPVTNPSGPVKRPLDGEGNPYITLAQLLKASDVTDTGGGAKHRVREGGITVNGVEELRPGRKLHTGDVVVVDGKKLTVTVE